MIYTLNFLLSSFLFFSYSFSPNTPLNNTVGDTHPTIENLSKKWSLTGYKYLVFSEDPSEKEKNDFLHFASDMTYTSISEGESDKGEWTLDEKDQKIHLNSHRQDGTLTFFIDRLSSNNMTLIIDDPTDEESRNLKIIFESKNP